MQTAYYGLPELGLPLVPLQDPRFDELVRDIQSRPQPFPAWPTADDLSSAAVLLNETGKGILIFAYVWRNMTVEGYTLRSFHSNLGTSNAQLEVLTGRQGIVRDYGTFILPASKRLITRDGMWGNNLDVLPGFDYSGGWVGIGGTGYVGAGEEIVRRELVLDLAILEDGLCVGPDENHAIEALVNDLERQREAACEIATALHDGASAGHAFDILRPLARRQGRRDSSAILAMFANVAMHHLVCADDGELRPWFERYAQSTPLHLRRQS